MNPVEKTCLGALLLIAAPIAIAQTPAQPTPAQPAPAQPTPAQKAPEKIQETHYVRRFSAGVSFSLQALPMIKNGSYGAYDTAAVLQTTSNTTELNHRLGAGVNGQFAFKHRWAVNAGAIYRETGYTSKLTYATGTDNPNTPIDERKYTDIEEKTQLAFYDFPILARYYFKDHTENGVHYFVQAGGTIRKAERIRTTRVNVDSANRVTSNATPAVPSKSAAMGYTAGAGMQFIGPFGVRIVPEGRYTRWTALSFNTYSTVSNRQQAEFIVSFTF